MRSHDGALTSFDPVGSIETEPASINAAGAITGSYTDCASGGPARISAIATAPSQASILRTRMEPSPQASARAERLLDTTTKGRFFSTGSCAHGTGRIRRLIRRRHWPPCRRRSTLPRKPSGLSIKSTCSRCMALVRRNRDGEKFTPLLRPWRVPLFPGKYQRRGSDYGKLHRQQRATWFREGSRGRVNHLRPSWLYRHRTHKHQRRRGNYGKLHRRERRLARLPAQSRPPRTWSAKSRR